jgi:nitroreductase
MGSKSMDALEAISKRRSVREYTGDGVPRAILEKIVDAGRLAASGGNNQPWEFIIVTNRKMIARFSMDVKWVEKSGAVIAVVLDTTSRWWLEDGAAAVENMLIASTALGYGSCWFEGCTQPREEEFKTILGIPQDKKLFTLVTIGVPVSWPTKEKKPLEEVMRWETY